MTEATILIVEDEEPIITMLQYNLEQEGFKVHSANDGQEGLIKVKEVNPDVIVLDYMLPGKSGIEVLRELREDPSTAPTPVLMLTAKGQAKDRAAASEAGASLFMTKPFSNAEILENIGRLAP